MIANPALAALPQYPLIRGHFDRCDTAYRNLQLGGGDHFVSGMRVLRDITEARIVEIQAALQTVPAKFWNVHPDDHELGHSLLLGQQNDGSTAEISVDNPFSGVPIQWILMKTNQGGDALFHSFKEDGTISTQVNFDPNDDNASHLPFGNVTLDHRTARLVMYTYFSRQGAEGLAKAVETLIGKEFDELGYSIVHLWNAFRFGNDASDFLVKFDSPRDNSTLIAGAETLNAYLEDDNISFTFTGDGGLDPNGSIDRFAAFLAAAIEVFKP